MSTAHERPSRTKILAAFAAIYFVWGSTFLAIKFAIETIPPFLMAGVRFAIAGTILFVFSLATSKERPTLVQWRNAAIVGALLLLVANGVVGWAEESVPSGFAALISAVVPFWMVLIEWLRPEGKRPSRGVVVGIVLGMVGLIVLIGPSATQGTPLKLASGSAGSGKQLVAAIALVFASLSWAAGSLFSRDSNLPKSGILATGMQMLCGGFLLLVFSAALGEFAAVDVASISMHSLLGLLYLIAFGSLIAFTTYLWLLKVAPAARVATYAYVNPVVALFLGWVLGGETMTMRTGIAAAIIVGAVAIITTAGNYGSRSSVGALFRART